MFRERREGWIGVDRGAGAVKVAQLRRVGGETRVAMAALTPRWARDGDSAPGDDQCCRRELDTVRALVGSWRTRQAAATTSMGVCTLSAGDEEQPEASASSCADAWSVGQNDRYTLTAPEGEVNALCDGFRLSGLECRVIDGAPLAIARALRLAPTSTPDRLVAGLDWGEDCATLVAAQNGRAVYARKLKGCGFGGVLESIAETLGLATSEAETLVRRHGVEAAQAGEGVAATVATTIGNATSPMLAEARRTLSHIGAKLKTSGPERLWGFGTGATPPGLMNYVGERLGIPAEPWRPASITLDPSTDAPACLFGQAIALSALAWEASR